MPLKDWVKTGRNFGYSFGHLNQEWINEKIKQRVFVITHKEIMNHWTVMIEQKGYVIEHTEIFNNKITATKYAKKYMETH